ncbi:anti-sigma factor antagonist [Paenibacillaceae bacterium]|nr:anti-sigma factor antagonist [Paenibacillaceae bacterium]
MNPLFTIRSRLFNQGMILDLQGELTSSAENIIAKKWRWDLKPARGRRYIILNFQDIQYIDSAGLTLLLRMASEAKNAGSHLFVFGICAKQRLLFRLVGLTGLVMIYPSEKIVLQRIGMLEVN